MIDDAIAGTGILLKYGVILFIILFSVAIVSSLIEKLRNEPGTLLKIVLATLVPLIAAIGIPYFVLHEQFHWFLTNHVERAKTNAALTELRALYPTVPTALPAGAMGERSTYLHLIVCHLELQALTALLGEQSARQQLER